MYNARHFRPKDYDFLNAEGPAVGTSIDFEARTLDGEPVRLSDLRGRPVVIETGSTTCPIYVNLVKRWGAVVAKWPEAHFVVLYVREAHPGGRIDAHASMEDKAKRARDLATWGEIREIWVDDLEGTVHRRFGSQPNSLLVVDADGRVAYFATWSDPDAADRALAALAEGAAPEGIVAKDRLPKPWIALRVLGRAGLRAVTDFMVGVPRLIPKRIRYRRKVRRQGEG